MINDIENHTVLMTAIEASPLSLPQSGMIKMEDRKRPSSYDQNDSAPPTKKQATTANGAGKSNADSDMPWKDDLERFQKDAIFRQMQDYKRQSSTLESALKEMRKRARDHDDHLRAIDAWLQQLIDEVKLLVPAVDNDDSETLHLQSSLLFPEQEKFEQHLATQADNIKSLVKRLFSRNHLSSPEISTLQHQVSKLLAAEKEHLSELTRLKAEVQDLEERLENASLRYMVAEKKLDRAKSVTAAKLEKGMLLGGSKPDEAGQSRREDGAVNGVTDHSEELAELEQEVKKSAAALEKQKEQIGKMEEQNAKLTTQVTELSTRTIVLTDEDYSKTELFKQLKSRHEDVIGRINNLEALNAELKEENNKLAAERTAYQSQLENDSRHALGEKDALLGRAEADLARVRGNRDELIADRDIKKATLDQEREAVKKLKHLVSAQEDRIKALEVDVERISMQPGQGMDVNSELDGMSVEAIKSKHQELDKKYQLLTVELTSMQTAFQKTSKLANQKVSEFTALEDKCQRLSVEKSKADQKYFAAMKSKEIRDGEVRTLRLQNTKSAEVVAQLKEAEAASRTLSTNMEKQLADLKEALNLKTNEQRLATQQSVLQASEVSRLSAQITEFKQQLGSKDIKFATTASACRSAEVEVEELKAALSETRRNLESWKSKSGQSEQYEMLRLLAYCGICKKNLKDTVIKLCGHTFCQSCVEERVAARARKCPNCGKAFGGNDYMRMTL